MKNPTWTPSEDRKRHANLTDFMRRADESHGHRFISYDELYDWSVKHPAEFWAFAWDYLGIRASQQYSLDHLRTVLSTGSPLSADSFEYVYRDLPELKI